MFVCLSSYLQVLTQTNLHSFVKVSFPGENIHQQTQWAARASSVLTSPPPSLFTHLLWLPSALSLSLHDWFSLLVDDRLREERGSASLILSAWTRSPPPPASGKAPSQSHPTSSPLPGCPPPAGAVGLLSSLPPSHPPLSSVHLLCAALPAPFFSPSPMGGSADTNPPHGKEVVLHSPHRRMKGGCK